jgi:hypothetical protein
MADCSGGNFRQKVELVSLGEGLRPSQKDADDHKEGGEDLAVYVSVGSKTHAELRTLC